MSIYNTEQWLREAVESIVSQDIGFEENIEVVFVNDGSPDGSEVICREYLKKYPNNIIYVKQPNKGLASARNFGLGRASGELINFFDPDDILSPNVLSEVYSFYMKNKQNNLALIAVPLVFFEAKEGVHPKYRALGIKNRMIRLDKEPDNFILSSASSFYPREIFEHYRFDELMHGAEDSKLNLALYQEKPQLGYVCERGVTYHYRQRKSGSSIMNARYSHPEPYEAAVRLYRELFDLSLSKNGRIDPYLQEAFMYDSYGRLLNLSPNIFASKKAYDSIVASYVSLIKQLDLTRVYESRYVEDKYYRFLLASCISTKKPSGIDGDGRLFFDGICEPEIQITAFCKKVQFGETFSVDVIFHDYNLKDLDVVLCDGEGNEISKSASYKTSSIYDIPFGKGVISATQYRRFELSLEEVGVYHLMYKLNNDVTPVRKPYLHKYLPFKIDSRQAAIYYRGHAISYKQGMFKVEKISSWNAALMQVKMLIVILRRYGRLPFLRLLARQKKRFIIINDYPNSSESNTFMFFKYINEKRPDLAKYVYYVVDKGERGVKNAGRTVKRGGLLHRFLTINARYIVTSNVKAEGIDAFKREDMMFYRDVMRRSVILLRDSSGGDDDKTITKFHESLSGIIAFNPQEARRFEQKRFFYRKSEVLEVGSSRIDAGTAGRIVEFITEKGAV